MAEDIVTRLREYEAITDNAYVINALIAAADEIERLRKEVEVWRKLAHNEHAAWSQCSSDCLCLSNDFRIAFRKAVRGNA